MKSSLGKFKKLALHKSDFKDKRHLLPTAQLDELAQAAQEMQDMRDCYDSLLSAAAAVANSAYEFSESLRDMGSCLLEKTALHEDEESGRVLILLGQVQFELQKLVDKYRSHVFLTITHPAESLLNELRTVEDMKRQCDEKRSVYEYMMTQHKEKWRSKGAKGETFTLEQLRAAYDEYHEEATLCDFRLKSLKQGQSRSLLTQAARHHAAQLNFFKKGLKSLEAIDPHVRNITEQQHIDYQFSALEDDEREDEVNGYDPNVDGELSFDYRADDKGFDATPASRNSVEVDEVGVSFPLGSNFDHPETTLDNNRLDAQVLSREHGTGSHSAPIFLEGKFDPAERVKQILQSSKRESNAYVLPTPNEPKGALSSKTINSASLARPTGHIEHKHNLWHSSPLEQKKHDRDSTGGQLLEIHTVRVQSVLKESNGSNTSTPLPPPLAEGPPTQRETLHMSETRVGRRKSVSGPLTSDLKSTKPVLSTSGHVASAEVSQLASGQQSQLPTPQALSSQLSPSASPPPNLSPRITELHALPRPPASLAKPAKSMGLVAHSAPLVSRNQETTTISAPLAVPRRTASPLPIPPISIPRSFSIPSSDQRAMALQVSRHLESSSPVPNKDTKVASPPLTPMSLMKLGAAATVTEVAQQTIQTRAILTGYI